MKSATKCEKRIPRRASGQTLLEFSLVVVFLVLVMIGIIDFSRFFYTYATISNAAREGARYGIIYPNNVHAGFSPDPDNITYRAQSKLLMMGNATESPNIEITFPDTCRSVGCRVSVKVTAYFKSWTPLIPRFQMVGQAIMYIE
jgi:Flp pilus assembly protein TadG